MPHPSRLVCLPLTALLLAGAALAQGTPAARRPPQGATCISLARKLSRSVYLSNDGRHQAEWRAEGCEVEVRFEGRLRFDEGFTALVGLERRGRFEVKEEGPVDRELEVRQEDEGLRYTYEVEGRRHDFDAEGRAWLESVLLQFFRRTGHAAQERAAWLLRRSGPEGVLAELEQMEGSHAQQAYLDALLRDDVEPRVLVRVLRMARAWESDHAKAGALEAMAPRLRGEPAARREAWAVARTLESDHSAAGSATRLLDAGRLQAEELGAALAVVERMESDHYRAAVLKALAEQPALKGAQVQHYLREAVRIGSDHYRAEVLEALTDREALEGAETVEVIRAASRIGSDHYRARVLVELAQRYALDGAAREAYRRAANDIGSDHYRKEALAALR